MLLFLAPRIWAWGVGDSRSCRPSLPICPEHLLHAIQVLATQLTDQLDLKLSGHILESRLHTVLKSCLSLPENWSSLSLSRPCPVLRHSLNTHQQGINIYDMQLMLWLIAFLELQAVGRSLHNKHFT